MHEQTPPGRVARGRGDKPGPRNLTSQAPGGGGGGGNPSASCRPLATSSSKPLRDGPRAPPYALAARRPGGSATAVRFWGSRSPKPPGGEGRTGVRPRSRLPSAPPCVPRPLGCCGLSESRGTGDGCQAAPHIRHGAPWLKAGPRFWGWPLAGPMHGHRDPRSRFDAPGPRAAKRAREVPGRGEP